MGGFLFFRNHGNHFHKHFLYKKAYANYTLFIDRINKFYKKHRTYGLFPEFILFNLKIIVLFNKQEFLYGIKTVRGLCGRC